jgi:hypothetical protein
MEAYMKHLALYCMALVCGGVLGYFTYPATHQHVHTFSMWSQLNPPTLVMQKWYQTRVCNTCGLYEMREVKLEK